LNNRYGAQVHRIVLQMMMVHPLRDQASCIEALLQIGTYLLFTEFTVSAKGLDHAAPANNGMA
jgi:hypothetical protein